jgi:D-glycero-D-manno-heptose 1,7-bisphosphate phosphatase
MVTNQSSVGKGPLSQGDLDQIQQRVQELLWEQDEMATLDRIYQSTSDDPCHPRRKPNPGMVLEAIKDFSCDHSTSYFVGDTSTDLQAAAAGGVDYRILVSTGYGRQLMRNRDSGVVPTEPLWIQNVEYNDIHPSSVPFLYCRNLAQAIDFILEHLEG